MNILCVDDESLVRQTMRRLLKEERRGEVFTADGPEAAMTVLETSPVDVVFLDYTMPGVRGLEVLEAIRRSFPQVEVVMLTGHANVPTVVQSMKLGAFDYIVKPLEPARLTPLLDRLERVTQLQQENAQLRERLGEQVSETTIIGEAKVMAQLRKIVSKAAMSDSTVLITGEHGTGKELVARTLHLAGPRAKRPFVPVECSSVSGTLFESELFGHARGAFTGAEKSREGLCKAAADGTLFLDEVAEIPVATQAKLLRVLQEREFRPVGANEYVPLKARIVAATNVDLDAAIADGRIREDLYYRLNVIQIELPPLRERREDIPALASYFLSALTTSGDRARCMSEAAMQRLCAYAWPGNVRELKNAVERALALSDGDEIRVEDLPGSVRGATAGAIDEGPPAEGGGGRGDPFGSPMTLVELERLAIKRALLRTRGNVPAAANQLGVSPSTIYRKLKSYGIDTENLKRDAIGIEVD